MGTDESALEAFYERCEAMNYEALDEPTVEQISLEKLLASVNDLKMNLTGTRS